MTALCGLCRADQSAAAIDYNRDVRPILSDKCFRCHGPDDATREAGLRLDVRDAALKTLESGATAIVPGKPGESQLVSRIQSTDPAEQMPPAELNKPLTDREKEILEQWIAEGAQFQQHWSFQPVVRPSVPEVQHGDWPKNDIDRFVLARLEAEGLTPSDEASRETLIRRVTLDLTGLPPTLVEIEAFLADSSDNAYETVVDRLLANPHYGERMALDWLDAARYADTHGYHIDSGRDMTRWREWVIDAFNNNLPFDQFTVEQIAGDLLPNATVDQKIASGFNRNHMINYEGGAIPEEYHVAYIVDRVSTLGAVWLGLTVGCAQCHDHKYDPISQREFYGLYAFFHNVPEKGLDGIKGNAAPFLKLPTAEQSAELDRLRALVADLDSRLVAPREDLDAAQSEWEQALAANKSVEWTPVTAAGPDGGTNLQAAGGATTKLLDDQSVLLSGENPVNDTYTITFETDAQPVSGLLLEALADDSLPGKGPGRFDNGNFVLSQIRITAAGVNPDGTATEPRPVTICSATADYNQPDFSIDKTLDDDPKSGWAIYPAIGKSHQATLEFEQPVHFDGQRARFTVVLDFQSAWGRHNIGRLKLSCTTSNALRSPESLPENIRTIVMTAAAERTEAQRVELLRYFRNSVSTETRELVAELKDAKEQLAKLDESLPTAMVMEELAEPRETFMLVRGQYDKKGDRVTAAIPAAFPPLPEGAPANRLGLAQWLVSPNQPLTARVTVNRYWQMFFGNGLVKTSEDFGSQGAAPSHSELLDWLAAEFLQGAGPEARTWDVKGLVRLIVTSATYRQSSYVSPEQRARDPEDRLLARAPRFRLQAEFIRDQALAVSGLLNPKIGGHSVSPYQPVGLWEELMSREDGERFSAQTYVQSHGPDLYRRTMYTFWKRTCPPPTLSTFDAPDREVCTVRRGRTNTPLQALVLLNDPTYVEASRKLAERILGPDGGDSLESRVQFAFRTVTGRLPNDREASILKSLLEAQIAKYSTDHAEAEKLLTVGESESNTRLDIGELAAWSTVASALLNLDEVVTRN
ncbi:MAG: PSD1 domain-containing protein [Planctomycetaceae bacterium]|nr:PSD1 domain-containing protein [Planctomycetaceae bacterium]